MREWERGMELMCVCVCVCSVCVEKVQELDLQVACSAEHRGGCTFAEVDSWASILWIGRVSAAGRCRPREVVSPKSAQCSSQPPSGPRLGSPGRTPGATISARHWSSSMQVPCFSWAIVPSWRLRFACSLPPIRGATVPISRGAATLSSFSLLPATPSLFSSGGVHLHTPVPRLVQENRTARILLKHSSRPCTCLPRAECRGWWGGVG